MTFSLADLINPKARDEFITEILAVADSLSLPTTAWQPGQWTRTMIALFAEGSSAFTKLIVEPIRGGFGDLLSSDDWANAWAKGQFDVDRVAATAATTDTYTATNASGLAYPVAAGDMIVANPVTGKTYRNQAAIVIPAGGSLVFAIAADEVGTGSNAAPATITTLVAPSLIGVTVTNPDACLGSDKETTPALVLRSRSKWGSLSPGGPKTAYDYVATTPFLPDGTPLSNTSTPITRAKTVADPLTGFVTVYIATSSGAPSGPDVAIVQTAIDKWAEPWCATATAVAATPHSVAVTYHAWIRSSLTAPQLQSAIATALAEFFATLPIGGIVIPPAAGFVYVEELDVVISGANAGTVKVTVSLPAADVAIADSEVPTLGAITPTITLL